MEKNEREREEKLLEEANPEFSDHSYTEDDDKVITISTLLLVASEQQLYNAEIAMLGRDLGYL